VSTVLWIGDAGCHTGFATVTHAIGERLVAKGHDVHVLATNYKGDYWPTSLKLYRPNMLVESDIYGQTRFIEMLGKVEPDVVVMLNDPWVVLDLLFKNHNDPQKILLKYRPILAYLPVDGYNAPQAWPDTLAKVTTPVTMSKFGQAQYPGSRLVYHGVDTSRFFPVSDERPITLSNNVVVTSKRDCKRAFGYDPDGFLVLRVDKNSGRKDFAATWKALVPVMQRHSDIQVHLHTVARDSTSGVDLAALLEREPALHPRFFTPDLHSSYIGWAQEDLNALYNAADLFVSTSRGEGFGLTLAESLACGVPVIAQNVSAIPEVVGPGGVLVEPLGPITVPSAQDVMLPDVKAFTEAIERAYLSRGLRRDLGAKGQEHVASFSWDVATDRFHDYIEELASGSGTSGGA
jgi:glycosyltransferase involved in cell wall biosynthesis